VKKITTRVRVMIAMALGVAVIGVVASVALANIKPEKADSILASSSLIKLTAGALTVECQVVQAAGTIEAGTMDAKLGTPGFHGTGGTECSPSVKVETSGTWKLIELSKTEGALEVPTSGAKITVGSCVVTLAPSAAAKAAGTWTNGSNSTTTPSDLTLSSAKVAIKESGCGGIGTEASLSGELLVFDTTAPSSAVVFG
jgi:hypothetical protein